MKKFFITIVLIFAVVVGFVRVDFYKNNETVGFFELTNYSEEIDQYNNYFPQDEKIESVGIVTSPSEAKKAAEAIWKEIYGDSVVHKKPYKVFFDEKNQVWLVLGTVFFMEGGPHILIQKSDGKILAVWHDKF